MSKEAMKLALEALEMYLNMDTMDESYLLEIDLAPKAITALRKALAEQPAHRQPADDSARGGERSAQLLARCSAVDSSRRSE